LVWVPASTQSEGLAQATAEGTKQCVATVVQVCPPLVVVYASPESQPDVTGVPEPPTMHSVGDAHVTDVRAFCPKVDALHVVPPSDVMMTDVPPTATHEVPVEQATESSEPIPFGTLCWAQVDPPSAETRTIPVLKVVSPTA
jgi:hypothetical protein